MSNRGTILVIEDDFAIGDLIIDALSDEGYAVHVVSDAAKLRGGLSTRVPDLVLCDLHLPGLSPRDVLAHVQQIVPSDVPIVLMTADTQAAS
jgi:DNA-binding response OmpR family regulator